MGAAEQELELAVMAPRYQPVTPFTMLADSLEDAHRTRMRAAAEPGWSGVSAEAASALFTVQGKRALANGDRVRAMATLLESANASLDNAKVAYSALPEANLGHAVLATVLAGGMANLGRFGMVSTVLGVCLVKRRMEIAREAAALAALRVLQRDLDGIAQSISQLDHALQSPNKFMPAPVNLGTSDTSEPDEFGFSIGSPHRPDIEWDEHFIYDSKSPEFDDYTAAAKWKAKSAGARVLRWDLVDGLNAYDHYWSNTGDPFTIDLDKAYKDDIGISGNIDNAIRNAQQSADAYAASGRTNFSITGAAGQAGAYPQTENWQKTIGAYQQWTSADVKINGNQATMVVTVHAEDYYNFNKGQSDIASGASDDDNGRFTEIGWAKPFETSGEYTRTVTWTVGDPESAKISEPESKGR